MEKKKFNVEEYRKWRDNDMQRIEKLEEQIEQSRREEDEKISKMSREERLKYYNEKCEQNHESVKDNFKDITVMEKKDNKEN